MTNSAIYLYYQGDRKPSDFADVRSIIDFNTLPAADQAAFLELDILNAKDEGITDPFSDIAEFWGDTQFFCKNLPSDMLLCIAKDLHTEGESIRTQTIADWKKKTETFGKSPCVFVVGR